MFDILIVGGGPAGLTAALYGRRAGKAVLVLEKNTFGGQISWSPKVENYPAIASVSGLELADLLTAQATEQGAQIELDEVTSVTREDDHFTVTTAFGETYEARTVIAATGAVPRGLGLEGEEALIGRGVSFCAVCDGEFYRGADVAVVGGGNSALQEALYLSDLCRRVYLIHRRDAFRADRALVDRASARENIQMIRPASVTALHGNDVLEGITVREQDTERTYSVQGLFLAIGHLPQNGLFSELLPLDEAGYAAIGESCTTPTPGLFVAGDCRAKSVRQLTTAASDGAVAALAACHYLDMQEG